MKYQLHRTQQLRCDINTAWSFFSSPNNLAQITPKDLNFVVLTDLGGADIFEGMEINYTLSPILKIPVKWKTRITDVQPKTTFTDVQEKGPYKLWRHHHEFIPNAKGVLMKDTVDYELPFGMIGNIAHGLLVRKKLKYIFDYRFRVLEDLFNKS